MHCWRAIKQSFILNSKGKILSFVHAINLQDELLLYGHGQNVQPTVDHLDKFLIREDVTLEDATGDWTGLFVSGATSDNSLTQLVGELPPKNRFRQDKFSFFDSNKPIEGNIDFVFAELFLLWIVFTATLVLESLILDVRWDQPIIIKNVFLKVHMARV